MTSADAKSVGKAPTREMCERSTRLILGNWKFWLAIAMVAVIAGAALNWGWLIAVGVAPLLLTLLPCAMMCALGLCLMKRTGADGHGPGQEPPAGPSHARLEGPLT